MIKNRNNSPFSILNFTLLLLLLLVLQSCSSSSKSGTLSSSVILNNDTGNSALDPVDYAGVTIALYYPAELDEDIRAVNLSHPNLGVIITQQTEFDHRLQTPYKSTVSAGDGTFTLKGIKPGFYNLVLLKQGWGIRYLYNVNITEGDNGLAGRETALNRNAVELYPVTELAGFVGSAFEFKSRHSYLSTDDTSFSGDVTFSPDSYLWISPSKKMTFYGNVTSPAESSEYIRVTSADKMYATALTPADISRYYSFIFAEQAQFSQNRLSSIQSSFSNFGMVVKTPGLTVSNMIFRNSRQGLTIEQIASVTITNCNLIAIDDPEQGGITISDCSDTICSNLIVKGCRVGIRQFSCENAAVTNCYFKDTLSKSIFNLYDTTSGITNCTFEDSDIAVDNSGESTTVVQYCNINARIGLYNYAQTNWVAAYFIANNNNFDCSQHAIKTFAVFYAEHHFNATYNYWGTGSSAEISGALIYDRYDVDPNDQDYYRLWGIVDYLPYRTSKLQTAGITAEP